MVEFLLSCGADENISDSYGRRPRDCKLVRGIFNWFFFEFFPLIYNFQDLFVSECDSRLSVDWLSLPLLDPGSKEVSSRIQFKYARDLFSAPVTFPLFFWIKNCSYNIIFQGTFTNQAVKGMASIERMPNELDAYKEWYSSYAFVPRWFRRFNESWWKWIPGKPSKNL